ncbi:MAG: PDZ domain-containing protein, partial [Planctomycetes bacterium]|nr:PDZ domain-containing protein [Planctomycetota bacterium]
MIQRTIKRLRLEFVVLAALIGGMLGLSYDAYNFFDPVVDVRAEVLRHYVKDVDETELLHGAINGMLEQLDDPYTVYFTAEQLASFEKHTRGTFSGIGAEIDQRDGHIGIVSPLEDSPAFEAGIVAGDLILAVDGNSLKGVSTEEAVKRITGPEGTSVTLTVRHPDGTEEDITIVRRRIEIETVKGLARDEQQHWDYMLDPEARIGYIRMTQFSQP